MRWEHKIYCKSLAADPGNAMTHLALADAWAILGYDAKAKAKRKRRLNLLGPCHKRENLSHRGPLSAVSREWDKAIETYRILFSFFPDNLDYGLQLSAAQVAASNAKDSLLTLASLRKLPSPFRTDPRIDLAEAAVAGQVTTIAGSANAASEALQKGKTLGARLIMAQALLVQGVAFIDSLGDAERTWKLPVGRGWGTVRRCRRSPWGSSRSAQYWSDFARPERF